MLKLRWGVDNYMLGWLVGSLVNWFVDKVPQPGHKVANNQVNGYISNLQKYRYSKWQCINVIVCLIR